jgi:ATP-dependent DNA helicase DinG
MTRTPTPLRLTPEAARYVRGEIRRAQGREVCFLARVTPERLVVEPRAVSRGNRDAVLAAARDETEGGVMLHNHPTGVLEPSDADLAVAARLFERGLGTAIVDNAVDRIYVVVEPPKPRRREPLDADVLSTVLAPGGGLSTVHAGYEDRAGQREMLRMVTRGYNEGGVSLVEAGTGIGKSLAYLVPAAAWARANRERTIVATATLNLQEQLVEKDLPLVETVLGTGVRWALVKGRGNYVSIRRAYLAAESAPSLFEEDRSGEIDALLEWMDTTTDGSRADLPFVPSDETWEEVRSDPDICLRARCPHFQQCFYQASRRRAAAAEVLVANHHLLFTDLSVRMASGNFTDSAVLPPYRHLVLDEAHNVEDAATAHLGVEATRRGLFRSLARLDRNGRGVLSAIQDQLGGDPERGAAKAHRSRIEERIRPALDEARSGLSLFMDDLEPLAPTTGEPVRLGVGSAEEPLMRAGLRERYDTVMTGFLDLERRIAELRSRIEMDSAWAESLDGRLLDLRSSERRLETARRALRLALNPPADAPEFVRWMELRRTGRRKTGNLALAAAPVEVGRLLREGMFERLESGVLTSATLTTRGRFDFMRQRLGLETGRQTDDPDLAPQYDEVETPAQTDDDDDVLSVVEAAFPSPFDFGRQTLFCVPTDLPDAAASHDEFQEASARAVESLARLTEGGLFVLFTSHGAVRRVAALLRRQGLPWPLFVHGEAQRARLLGDFIEAGDGILLGTASFWEGVDVPGHPLRGLVIQKLPFRVPTEPITEARVEALERHGGNAFWDFMLPHAALRLKQGFGRLVRSRDDRGAVVLLDDRILRKRYGRYLRDSLPPAPLVKGPWDEVMMALRKFYGLVPGVPPDQITRRQPDAPSNTT